MGNRAHVIFTDKDGDISPAVYLHWNGGPESVYAFLDEMKRRKIRCDASYGTARFVHIVGDFFDSDEAGGLSLGIHGGPKTLEPASLKQYDHGDNGVYVVSWNGTERTVRRFSNGKFADARRVESERIAAENDDTYAGILETLAEQRPTVSRFG